MPQGDVEAPHGMTRIDCIDAEKTPRCCWKQSYCIRRQDHRTNHRRCWPSTLTTSKARHARICCDYPAMGSQAPTYMRMARHDICGVVVLCPTAAQRGALRDTRRALCHVVRRFWQTRYRLVWERN